MVKISMILRRSCLLSKGSVVVLIVYYLDLQLSVQSVTNTLKVVSLTPVYGEVYSIEHNVIKFVSNVRQDGGFLRVLWFPPSIKLTSTI